MWWNYLLLAMLLQQTFLKRAFYRLYTYLLYDTHIQEITNFLLKESQRCGQSEFRYHCRLQGYLLQPRIYDNGL